MGEKKMTKREVAIQLLAVRCLRPNVNLRFNGNSYCYPEDLIRDGVTPGYHYTVTEWFSDENGTCVSFCNDRNEATMMPIDEFDACVRLIEGGKDAAPGFANLMLVQGGKQ